MANEEQLAILKKGTETWNKWRENNPDTRVDLIGADLRDVDLTNVDLRNADLSKVNLNNGISLYQTDFRRANLSGANLNGTSFNNVKIFHTNFSHASLQNISLNDTVVATANFSGANLRGASCKNADFRHTNLSHANLSRAHLENVDFNQADLSEADLNNSNLNRAVFVDANLNGADLTGCSIYGISAWNVGLENATQKNLIITPENEPRITVDNLDVAQFIYLMINNQKIKNVIDTITAKSVLILGRFTEERKKVLDAIRDDLRYRNYLPIVFDFEPSANRNLTETVTLLARMSRFIIADLSSPMSIPQELTSIIPLLPSVPVQPIIISSQREYAMYNDWKPYPWILKMHKYESLNGLMDELTEKVIAPAEKWIEEQKGKQ